MCGFGGIINNNFPIHKTQVAEIAARVCHRGPDSCDNSIFDEDMQKSESGFHAIFFNRLAILDLDHRSDQPFSDERYTMIFNGEIYNYQSIKSRLIEKGFVFHTTSDTEVLFTALKYWGSSVIRELNGMFAFFFLDKKEKKFIMARDRMGIKPLYYRQADRRFIFSSDLDTIARLSHDTLSIDQNALRMFLWMQFIPTPFTAFTNVYKLPPGQFIEGSLEHLNKQEILKPAIFWDAYAEVRKEQTISQTENLESVLTDSLRKQLVADVPLGLFLSSGIDSSLLAALVNKYFAKEQTFKFFTVAFSQQTKSDESLQAKEFIKAFNNPQLVTDTLTIDPAYIGQHLDSLYDFIDEPFGDPTVLLNWVISKKAKEHVTVALSGDGADELFWGYPRYEQWQQKMLQMPGKFRVKGRLTSLLSRIAPSSHYRKLASLISEDDKAKRHFNFFLYPAFFQLMKDHVSEEAIWAMRDIPKSKNNELTSVLDIKTYLADAMLYKVDRSSMAASLEVRVPYLDNHVVDYALALPLNQKSNAQHKYKAPLKSLLSKLAPQYDINRPKQGFNFPLDEWLRNNWKDKVLSMVSVQALESLGLNGKTSMKIVLEYYKGNKRNSVPVWYLLNLMMWKQKNDQTGVLRNEALSHHNN